MPEGPPRAPLPPGSTIGILGSGQLGRMLALAAARLGLKTHIYCEERGPAFDVATRTSKGRFDDEAALAAFAAKVDAVTYEFENVAVATARHLARFVPVRPSAKALEVTQDRLAEKQFIAALGILAPIEHRRPEEIGDDDRALAALAILKSRRLT
jgi:5-(carboxyamino)imidazole ribonucleotide synthase